jgi:hypothetical protein
MAIYSLATNTTVTTTTAPAYDAKASSSNQPRVMEFGINLGAATASTYGIGRSANTPTQSGAVTVLAENYNDPAGQTTTAVAWTTAPTVPANFFRRISLPSTIGAGIIWTFPRGLILQSAGPSFTLWNLAVNSASTNVHIVVDE